MTKGRKERIRACRMIGKRDARKEGKRQRRKERRKDARQKRLNPLRFMKLIKERKKERY